MPFVAACSTRLGKLAGLTTFSTLLAVSILAMSRKRRQESACENYLGGHARKAHKLRSNLDNELRVVEPEEDCSDTASTSTRSGGCTTCAPVLETCKHAFQSLIRQGAELRHCKNVLPNPKKPDVQHYRNLVKQNAWIRSNLFDALGNYKYCSACIISILGIGSQRLLHQRSIKQREAHIPIVDMSKSSNANDRLEEYVVMPPEADNFKKWWDTLADTELVKVRYPHDQHGLARKPSKKRTMREHFF